jgi:arabinofuranosyltransferase
VGKLHIHWRRWILAAAVVAVVWLYAYLVLRASWVSDDSIITLRTVDNFLHGYGLRWNVGERVQTYTHPLWLLWLIMAGWVSKADLVKVLFVSGWLMSGTVMVILVWKFRQRPYALLLGVTILALSKAYIDFSTSGLENPLSHLLAILFFLTALDCRGEKRLPLLFLLGGLAAVNRLDMILLYAPFLVYEIWITGWRKVWRPALVGLFPLIAWLIFSVVYYGFPLPNTAYAKLGAGIPQMTFLRMGWQYVQNSLLWGPITLTSVVFAGGLACLHKDKRYRWFMLGVLLYILLVVRDGGDFMSGRFFTTGLLLSVLVIIETLPRLTWRSALISLGIVVLLGAGVGERSPIFQPITKSQTPIWDGNHIADEGRFYCAYTCWQNLDNMKNFEWAKEGIAAAKSGISPQISGFIGMWGYYAGPAIDIIDYLGLGDPLMARLPMENNANWGHGHFPRYIPLGYVETVQLGVNTISEPCVNQAYTKLATVTAGPILSRERWKNILYLNSPWGMQSIESCRPAPKVNR